MGSESQMSSSSRVSSFGICLPFPCHQAEGRLRIPYPDCLGPAVFSGFQNICINIVRYLGDETQVLTQNSFMFQIHMHSLKVIYVLLTPLLGTFFQYQCKYCTCKQTIMFHAYKRVSYLYSLQLEATSVGSSIEEDASGEGEASRTETEGLPRVESKTQTASDLARERG